jgi:isoleucyl-tRNA synthetase
MVALIFVFFSSNIFAQTNEEYHANLTSYHQSIMKHANAIASGEAKTLNDQITNFNEARKSLADAKKAHSQLKKVIPEKLKSEAIIHHDNIDRYHATATSEANLLGAELKNSNPDNAKLKEHAKKLHDDIELAEKEHLLLIRESK